MKNITKKLLENKKVKGSTVLLAVVCTTKVLPQISAATNSIKFAESFLDILLFPFYFPNHYSTAKKFFQAIMPLLIKMVSLAKKFICVSTSFAKLFGGVSIGKPFINVLCPCTV